MKMKDDEAIKQKIMNYWSREDENRKKKTGKALVRDIATTLDIPEIIVEKYIAEWESGKSV